VTPGGWKDRRVLVTGHTGFKGAWLVQWLRSLGATVSGYSLAPVTSPSLYADAKVAGDLALEEIADIRDAGRLAAFVAKAAPDLVVHMAAQSLVRRSYAEPAETFSTNVTGTVNLLEAVRACRSVRAVIVVTSDKCYANTGLERGYREDDPLGGADPYSSSKAAAELVTAAWRSSFFDKGAAIASARAGNVIGGGDWSSERLMTDLVEACSKGRTLKLRHPDSVRPWQHVLDCLHGYVKLADALLGPGREFAEAWNFGPAAGGSKPVSWVVESAARQWGAAMRWELDPGPHPPEAAQLRLDAGKAQQRLGWKPLLNIDETLGWAVEWYREHAQARDRARALCTQQTDRFMERAGR
jgi:CDP-glucose 4,6-dehydratase